MTERKNWKTRFDREMDAAERARQEGHEGRARVGARRAAGIVVQEFLERQGIPTPQMTAFDRIKLLAKQAGLSPQVQQVLTHLMLRVAEDYTLPSDVDLLADARRLATLLLADTPPPSSSRP